MIKSAQCGRGKDATYLPTLLFEQHHPSLLLQQKYQGAAAGESMFFD